MNDRFYQFHQTYRINKLKYHELMNTNIYGGGNGKKDESQKKIEIYIMRHGESEANEANITQGSEYDTGLTQLGKEQSKKTGLYFKKFRLDNGNTHFDVIYSSPLKRSFETAAIIKDITHHDKDIIRDNRLIERSKGLLSGLDKNSPIVQSVIAEFNKLKPEDPIERYDRKISDKIYQKVSEKYKIDGESDLELENRASKFLEDIMSYNITNNNYKILIVSHGAILAAMIRYMMNISWVPFVHSENCWLAYVTYDLKNITKKSKNKNNDRCNYRLASPPNTYHLELELESNSDSIDIELR